MSTGESTSIKYTPVELATMRLNFLSTGEFSKLGWAQRILKAVIPNLPRERSNKPPTGRGDQ